MGHNQSMVCGFMMAFYFHLMKEENQILHFEILILLNFKNKAGK
jgi:hypothetical protein